MHDCSDWRAVNRKKHAFRKRFAGGAPEIERGNNLSRRCFLHEPGTDCRRNMAFALSRTWLARAAIGAISGLSSENSACIAGAADATAATIPIDVRIRQRAHGSAAQMSDRAPGWSGTRASRRKASFIGRHRCRRGRECRRASEARNASAIGRQSNRLDRSPRSFRQTPPRRDPAEAYRSDRCCLRTPHAPFEPPRTKRKCPDDRSFRESCRRWSVRRIESDPRRRRDRESSPTPAAAA